MLGFNGNFDGNQRRTSRVPTRHHHIHTDMSFVIMLGLDGNQCRTSRVPTRHRHTCTDMSFVIMLGFDGNQRRLRSPRLSQCRVHHIIVWGSSCKECRHGILGIYCHGTNYIIGFNLRIVFDYDLAFDDNI